MRTNKPAIIWSSIISIVSLTISIITHIIVCVKCEYISNLFAGIFASGVLALLIAIINYRSERRKTLEQFYSYVLKVASNFDRFEYSDDIERSIDSVLQIKQFDYLPLDNAYGDMDFLFGDKKKRKYIYNKIYKPILDCRDLITEKAFHFTEYKKAANGNKKVMKIFVDDIANILLTQKEDDIIEPNGHVIKFKGIKPNLTAQLRNEINGEYYSIMYPHNKEDNNNAD